MTIFNEVDLLISHRQVQHLNQSNGFTLVELVMIIVMLGILSTSALPRFFDLSAYQQRAFFDDTLSAIRYAQKLAMATNCNVQVTIAANQFELKRPTASNRSLCHSTSASDFSLAVSRPGSGESHYTGSLSGITLSDATVYFTGKGTASSDLLISIGSKTIAIVKDTGFVYDSSP